VLPDSTTIQRPISRTEINQKVRGILSEQLDIAPEELPEYARFDQTDADSLDGVEILMAIEESFEIELDFLATMTQAPTVGQLCDLVEGAVKAGGIS
jgi:acyl carrier protein